MDVFKTYYWHFLFQIKLTQKCNLIDRLNYLKRELSRNLSSWLGYIKVILYFTQIIGKWCFFSAIKMGKKEEYAPDFIESEPIEAHEDPKVSIIVKIYFFSHSTT